MIYNELIERGSEHFPLELYLLDKNHERYEMSSHWHNEVEFIRIISGELNIKLNLNEYIAKKGDIVFVNPQTVHGATPIDECIYECIVMRFDFLNAMDNDIRFFIDCLMNNQIYVNEYNNNPPKLFKESVNYLFDSMRKTSPGYKFSVTSALYNLLGAIIDNDMYTFVSENKKIPENKNISKLKKILTYIRENYHTQITLDDMAKAAKMSPKYFCSFFKEMTRKTPIEYLILYRIECAAKKIHRSDESITDIAYSCGFNDLSYFIKTFKNIKGVTPAKFRHNESKDAK